MVTEQESPRLEIEEGNEFYARVVAEPLTKGFGTTVGNALRRVSLSALPGAAVVAARIDQVQHEFSTIEHMKEDTTEFLLNLRAIRLRTLSDRPAKLFLDVTGTREVTAADIEVPGDYEIANPELYLASLDSQQARLTVTLDVERGFGYVPAETGGSQPIGVIPLDAVFTPVRKVNYKVEPTRVGQESDLDRLVLEIWTDGTITGEDALQRAAQVLQEELALFANLGQPPAAREPSPSERLGLSPEAYNTSIELLNLSVRAYNCLKRSGLMTVGQILEKNEEELLALRNFGEKSYFELVDRLFEMGFISEDDSRLRRSREGVFEGEQVSGDFQQEDASRLGALADADADGDDDDEEISSLGTALLEALREAGQEPEGLR